MATRTIVKESTWNRPVYERKELSRATSNAPAWAWGCELCEFGRQADGSFCTCRAGQGRARLAAGIVVDDADDVHVPTFNAAYGGGA